ncbi:hypothetical protein JW887_02570 [Candidatus Dojkabacteria bacterium]|nr:hypothetical protein [Candidatus Dojkabacteria bacterium]
MGNMVNLAKQKIYCSLLIIVLILGLGFSACNTNDDNDDEQDSEKIDTSDLSSLTIYQQGQTLGGEETQTEQCVFYYPADFQEMEATEGLDVIYNQSIVVGDPYNDRILLTTEEYTGDDSSEKWSSSKCEQIASVYQESYAYAFGVDTEDFKLIDTEFVKKKTDGSPIESCLIDFEFPINDQQIIASFGAYRWEKASSSKLVGAFYDKGSENTDKLKRSVKAFELL